LCLSFLKRIFKPQESITQTFCKVQFSFCGLGKKWKDERHVFQKDWNWIIINTRSEL